MSARSKPFTLILAAVMILAVLPAPGAHAAGRGMAGYLPTRYGATATFGNTYDPTGDIDFLLLTWFVLFDYDRVWGHRAPEALRFKVEATLGATTRPWTRLMTSGNILGLYYLDRLAGRGLRPYLEGGIGVIYTDWRVKGEGLRFNFNPQIGGGLEFPTSTSRNWFAGARLYHISNGELYHENRGVNSLVLLVGRIF